MTNMGIVLPEAPYHEVLRALTREHGTLLIIDETHTFSAGPGGCTQAWGLEPDLLTIGKAIGGGVPTGALGLSRDVARADARARPRPTTRTPAASAGRWPATRCRWPRCAPRLGSVLTDDVWEHTIPLATRFAEGVRNGYRRACRGT